MSNSCYEIADTFHDIHFHLKFIYARWLNRFSLMSGMFRTVEMGIVVGV